MTLLTRRIMAAWPQTASTAAVTTTTSTTARAPAQAVAVAVGAAVAASRREPLRPPIDSIYSRCFNDFCADNMFSGPVLTIAEIDKAFSIGYKAREIRAKLVMRLPTRDLSFRTRQLIRHGFLLQLRDDLLNDFIEQLQLQQRQIVTFERHIAIIQRGIFPHPTKEETSMLQAVNEGGVAILWRYHLHLQMCDYWKQFARKSESIRMDLLLARRRAEMGVLVSKMVKMQDEYQKAIHDYRSLYYVCAQGEWSKIV